MSETDDLRKRLERLGVGLGLSGFRPKPVAPAEPPRPREAIEDWVSGREVPTALGPCFVAETRYPLQHVHGLLTLGALLEHGPRALGSLAGERFDGEAAFQQFAFVDTETTGLAGGTGTYAFLIGVGTFENGEFVLRQCFMRDLPEEGAALLAVREVLQRARGLVTFNGRAFDWPLLETRFAMNRQPAPPVVPPHLDLLLPARRLWRLRLRSCALSSLEANVLGVVRAEADVPGWAIPGLYHDFLTYGRAEPLRRVFYHNAHDILSLATLAAHLCLVAREPVATLRHGEDLFSLARRCEADGDVEQAATLYRQCLRCPLSSKARREATHRLSLLHKRAGQAEEALALWQALAERGDYQACVELAKHYEHRAGDPAQARQQALRALALLRAQRYPDRRQLAEIEHRLARLEAKIKRSTDSGS
ncbi:MAG TPA: tetratricopeptide repeat protein [Anaerolineae bacterium]|nr:tetratricopeptide repeat protein [Anaerolineae bacterium]HOQ97257.1 tetratricopeptide repeat protein [Anaerolineae bacterium]HPL27659.1 tetratricopeptide repeat protein [Anaerolineae bacterium]